MVEPLASLALAERVAEAARAIGIETAVIGALALAAHHYVRGTRDVDLATKVDPRTQLRELEAKVRTLGLQAELRLPDDDDPLGGVLVVWEREDDEGERLELVEVVNFYNPFAPHPNPAADAIKNAVSLAESPLRYVRLPDLVALKLYAGSRRDLADIVELLACNSDTNLEEVRAAAHKYGFDVLIEELIAEAAQQR